MINNLVVQSDVPVTAKSGKGLSKLAFGNSKNADCLVANCVRLRPHCHRKQAKRVPFFCVCWTLLTPLQGLLKGSFWTFGPSLPLVKGLCLLDYRSVGPLPMRMRQWPSDEL